MLRCYEHAAANTAVRWGLLVPPSAPFEPHAVSSCGGGYTSRQTGKTYREYILYVLYILYSGVDQIAGGEGCNQRYLPSSENKSTLANPEHASSPGEQAVHVTVSIHQPSPHLN